MSRVISFDEAKRRYVHRFTMEYLPRWAVDRAMNGKFYAPQYRSDREWYDSSIFPGEAHVDKRSRYCESNRQTWPLGNWLDQPYRRVS
jgi:hypothetical protein